MRSYWQWLLLAWLGAHAGLAGAVSEAPLQAISSYIEHKGTCSEEIVDWNRDYGPKAIAGETNRSFYYRVLGYKDWGPCGKVYFRAIFGELQKAWTIFSKGLVSEAEFEAKEMELVNLFFAAVEDEDNGGQLVERYERRTAGRLINEIPPRQYSVCTYFGDKPFCVE